MVISPLLRASLCVSSSYCKLNVAWGVGVSTCSMHCKGLSTEMLVHLLEVLGFDFMAFLLCFPRDEAPVAPLYSCARLVPTLV